MWFPSDSWGKFKIYLGDQEIGEYREIEGIGEISLPIPYKITVCRKRNPIIQMRRIKKARS